MKSNKIIQTFKQFDLNKKMFEDVSEIAYSQIGMSDRIIMTEDDEIKYKPTPTSEQQPWYKPKGLWYGIGSSWIDWVRLEMPHWERENIFEIKINMEKMLILDTRKDIENFLNEYKSSLLAPLQFIDWERVASKWGGIELTENAMSSVRFEWMNPWDVPSGCLWGDNMLISTRKIT